MTYEVEINGRTRRLEVTRIDKGYAVSVDGRPHVVDVTTINGLVSLILGDNGIRSSYEVAIVEQPLSSGNLTVHVNGRAMTAVVGTSRGSWARRGQDAGATAGAGPRAVTAPMPGKVVKMLVKAGDVVTARQGLVVVEAMKMENELRASKAGTVAEVKVTEGASVEAGMVLVVIE
jgi:biotin carboxyl carrier protein